MATFYPYLADLPIAQVMFLAGLTVAVLGALALPAGRGGRWLRRSAAIIAAAGLLVAGTAVALAGTGKLDAHGMIAIPALHDAASDRPVRYTPVCSHTRIPVCLNPAYAGYLRATAAALAPVLAEVAGLPGAHRQPDQPGRRDLPAGTGQLGRCRPGWAVHHRPAAGVPPAPARPATGPAMTTSALAAALRSSAGPAIVAGVTGGGPGACGAAGGHGGADDGGRRPAHGPPRGIPPGIEPGMPPIVLAPGSRPLPRPGGSPPCRASARHTWLMRHLAALRAGEVTLAQLP